MEVGVKGNSRTGSLSGLGIRAADRTLFLQLQKAIAEEKSTKALSGYAEALEELGLDGEDAEQKVFDFVFANQDPVAEITASLDRKGLNNFLNALEQLKGDNVASVAFFQLMLANEPEKAYALVHNYGTVAKVRFSRASGIISNQILK